jgi:hypothetical protein
MLEKYVLCQKSYLCKILFMLSDSNGFNPYIFFVFNNLSMYHTHTHVHTYIYSIGPTPKSVEYRFFGQFLMFPELLRQFLPDMSGLWPGHT